MKIRKLLTCLTLVSLLLVGCNKNTNDNKVVCVTGARYTFCITK